MLQRVYFNFNFRRLSAEFPCFLEMTWVDRDVSVREGLTEYARGCTYVVNSLDEINSFIDFFNCRQQEFVQAAVVDELPIANLLALAVL